MLKLEDEVARFHKLIRKSSHERKLSPSAFTESEWMWYAWPLAAAWFRVRQAPAHSGHEQ